MFLRHVLKVDLLMGGREETNKLQSPSELKFGSYPLGSVIPGPKIHRYRLGSAQSLLYVYL